MNDYDEAIRKSRWLSELCIHSFDLWIEIEKQQHRQKSRKLHD